MCIYSQWEDHLVNELSDCVSFILRLNRIPFPPPLLLFPFHHDLHRRPYDRFIDSESNLDSALHSLTSTLPQNPKVFYPEFVKAGSVSLLAELLSHENTDIALDVVMVLVELTEEDVEGGEEDEDEDEDEEEQGSGARGGMGALINALVRLCNLNISGSMFQTHVLI